MIKCYRSSSWHILCNLLTFFNNFRFRATSCLSVVCGSQSCNNIWYLLITSDSHLLIFPISPIFHLVISRIPSLHILRDYLIINLVCYSSTFQMENGSLASDTAVITSAGDNPFSLSSCSAPVNQTTLIQFPTQFVQYLFSYYKLFGKTFHSTV